MVENKIQHIQAVRQICGTLALTTNRWLRGLVEIEGFWRDFQREINRAMEEYVSELHWWRWHNTSQGWEIRLPYNVSNAKANVYRKPQARAESVSAAVRSVGLPSAVRCSCDLMLLQSWKI